MDANLIQWPKAVYWTKQWNPWIGCQPVSPACEHCYAAAIARRFKLSFTPHRTKQKMPKTGVVFCGNMTDCFGDWVPERERSQYILESLKYKKAIYLWLSKRAENLHRAIFDVFRRDVWHEEISGNANQFFGITAENQSMLNERYGDLFPMHSNGWLSAEPLLGQLDMTECVENPDFCFKWVVVGCESGPQRRPCKLEWVEDIVRQCQEHHTPVFVKQLDLNGKCVTDINQFPAHLRIRQVPWSNKENT